MERDDHERPMSGGVRVGPACGCCAECEAHGGDFFGCTGSPVPRYISVRFSDIEFAQGMMDAGSNWTYAYVADWFRKHCQGEGPDIVLDAGVDPAPSTWPNLYECIFWDGAYYPNTAFTGSDETDPDNWTGDVRNQWRIAWLYLELDLIDGAGGDYMTLSARFGSPSATPFFESQVLRPDCGYFHPTPDQPYFTFENEVEADLEGSYSDTNYEAINRRSGGGIARVRACATLNGPPGGDPTLGNYISRFSGSYQKYHKPAWDVTFDCDFCFNESGGVQVVIDTTVEVENPAGYVEGGSGFKEFSCDSCFGYTRNVRENPDPPNDKGCQYPIDSTTTPSGLDVTAFAQGGVVEFSNLVSSAEFYILPWTESGFDPTIDTIADGGTFRLWCRRGNATTPDWEEAGTVTLESTHGDPSNREGWGDHSAGGDNIVCGYYEDTVNGFKFTHITTHFSQDATSGFGEIYCRSLCGIDEVDVDTFATWKAAIEALAPGCTVSKVDHATAPLLERVTITDWPFGTRIKLKDFSGSPHQEYSTTVTTC